MKRAIFLLVAVLCASATSAQERRELNPLNEFSESDCGVRNEFRDWRARDYLNVGYVFQTSFDRAFNDGPPLTANTKRGWGMSVVYGTSYILHRRPVLGRLRFGVDATWLDVNYANGQTTRLYDGKARTHQLDLGMGIGPAVRFGVARNWTVDVHFRYNPTFATYYNEAESWKNARLGYASMWTSGAAASWRLLSLGAEVRFGRGTYRRLDWEEYVVPDIPLNLPPIRFPQPAGPRSAMGSMSDSAAGETRAVPSGVVVAQHPGGNPGTGGGASYIYGTTDDRVMKLRTIGARVYVGLRF